MVPCALVWLREDRRGPRCEGPLGFPAVLQNDGGREGSACDHQALHAVVSLGRGFHEVEACILFAQFKGHALNSAGEAALRDLLAQGIEDREPTAIAHAGWQADHHIAWCGIG